MARFPALVVTQAVVVCAQPNRQAERKKKTGRPTDYNPDYAQQAHALALLGLTDEEMWPVFSCSPRTFSLWKSVHPEFSQALKDGRKPADGKVAQSLYSQALSGNVTACIFWLKNRQTKLWRDRSEIDHGGSVEVAGLPGDILSIMRKLATERARSKPDGKG